MDILDQEEIEEHRLSESYRQFIPTLLLASLSMFLNRFAFYGFRSIFFIYMTTESHGFGFTFEDTGSYYEYYNFGLFAAFVVAGVIIMYWKRTGLSIVAGQGLALLGYASFLAAPDINPWLAITLIIAGEALYRISLYTIVGHNFLAAGRQGFTSFLVLYLILHLGMLFANKVIDPVGSFQDSSIVILIVCIVCFINLIVLASMYRKAGRAVEKVNATLSPAITPPWKYLAVIGLSLFTLVYWFFYSINYINLLDPKVMDVDTITTFGVEATTDTLSTFSTLVPALVCVVLIIVVTNRRSVNLLTTIGIALFFTAMYYGLQIAFHTTYSPEAKDVTLHAVSILPNGIADVLITTSIIIFIIREFRPWMMAGMYGLYMTIAGASNYFADYFRKEDTNFPVELHINLLWLLIGLLLVAGIVLFILRSRQSRMSNE